MKICAIIQARMGSTRLPGKILHDICGQPMLLHVIERVCRVAQIDAVCVATTDTCADEPVVALVERLSEERLETQAYPSVTVVTGSEDDVLARYYQAATAVQADIIIRITADCPLISPQVITQVLDAYLTSSQPVDYVSNTLQRSFPHGLDCEIISMDTLRLMHHEATACADREHVMPFVWRQPERFRLVPVVNDTDMSHYRWTVDTPQDIELVRRIYAELYPHNPHFEWQDAAAVMHQHPEWLAINGDVQQKKYGE